MLHGRSLVATMCGMYDNDMSLKWCENRDNDKTMCVSLSLSYHSSPIRGSIHQDCRQPGSCDKTCVCVCVYNTHNHVLCARVPDIHVRYSS